MRWLGLCLGLLLAGCGAHNLCRGGAASASGTCLGVGTLLVAEELTRLHTQSDRIMGEPETVDATHALAESAGWWDDGNTELIQPGDSCPHEYGFPHESGGELTAPAPRRPR